MSEQILDRPQTGAPQGVLPGIDSGEEKPSSRKRSFILVGLAIVAGWWITGGAWGVEWKDYAEFLTEVPSRA